jgi:hypothetical protein
MAVKLVSQASPEASRNPRPMKDGGLVAGRIKTLPVLAPVTGSYRPVPSSPHRGEPLRRNKLRRSAASQPLHSRLHW